MRNENTQRSLNQLGPAVLATLLFLAEEEEAAYPEPGNLGGTRDRMMAAGNGQGMISSAITWPSWWGASRSGPGSMI